MKSHHHSSFVKKTISLTLVYSFVITNLVVGVIAGPGSRVETETNINVGYSTDLTELGRQGRLRENSSFEAETDRLVKALGGESRRQPVLIDEKDEAQELIVEQLAVRIGKRSVPPALADKSILKLESAALFSNARNNTDALAAVETVIEKAAASNGRTLLFIDNLANVVGRRRDRLRR